MAIWKHIKGGNRPHSNTESWVPKKENKEDARVARRIEAKKVIIEQLKEDDNA
jgi:hypothetical protein